MAVIYVPRTGGSVLILKIGTPAPPVPPRVSRLVWWTRYPVNRKH